MKYKGHILERKEPRALQTCFYKLPLEPRALHNAPMIVRHESIRNHCYPQLINKPTYQFIFSSGKMSGQNVIHP